VTNERAPQAAILFDKFHILRHLGEALDAVRKSEYVRLTGKARRYIKGQKYTLLSHRENLALDGQQGPEDLVGREQAIAHRLPAQGVLRSTLKRRARGLSTALFVNWRASLKWPRLPSYEKFAGMIDRHWEGIAAYGTPENKVSLGVVEGLNNKIRVIQRRAYGLRDEEYLRLKILTCMLPTI
jgi:transposase